MRFNLIIVQAAKVYMKRCSKERSAKALCSCPLEDVSTAVRNAFSTTANFTQ
jgi:hypothetical protein